MKTTSRIQSLERKVQTLKTQLTALGDLRPGSLSKQYNVCGKPGCRCKHPKHPQRHGPYYQLSWVHRGKSTTQFIRRPWVKTVQSQIDAYRQFRKLTQRWVDLALQIAKLKLRAAAKRASN